MLPGKAIIGAALVLLSAAAVFVPSASATKPCPIEYCTDSSGEYVLEVPPLTTNPFLAAYADCVWSAHVEFGDGTSEDYVFDAAVGITGSHVFPTPGTTYTVEVSLSDGHHGQTKDPCPDYYRSAEVLYRTPAEEADEPAPWVPIDQGGIQPEPLPVAPDSSTPNAWTQNSPATVEPTSYWQRCRGAVFTHLVSCKKGRRVAKTASDRLARPGTARANGFACHLPPGSRQSIVCRRGEQGVLVRG